MVSVSGTLSAISNDKSLVLFNTIALANGDSSILISRLNLTRKQYYSRMSDLTNAGVIRRKNGKYFLTSFGKVVYEAQELIGKAVQFYSKLQAIDSIETPEFPAAELSKIIDGLITNSKIKEILISAERRNIYIAGVNEKTHNKDLMISAPTKRSGMRT
jgi:hypothetical protein